MVIDGLAVVASGLRVEFGHMVDIGLGEAAGIIDFGNLCRQWSVAGVLLAAGFVAVLRGLAFAVVSGVTFHVIYFYGLFLLTR